jgi:chromosome segregation ATPase
MTNEEMERMMQFILQHQANFAANQQQHDERIAVLEANMAELARTQAEMGHAQADMGRAQADMGRAQAEMGRAQAEMRRAQTHLSEVVAEMVDSQKHTQDKLDAFIGVLERYIAEGKNGKAGGESEVRG